MSENVQFLDFSGQLLRLEAQGITINDRAKAENKLKTIGYYKLKGFAYPLAHSNNANKPFEGINFDDLVLRYYQDKNLRIFLLHAIEKIEVSVKVTLGYVLGSKYGAFGYINFSKWVDRKRYASSKRIEMEQKFCKDLKEKIDRSTLPDLKNPNNLNMGLPSIWLAMDLLTFGDVVYLLKIMSRSNLIDIANEYGFSYEELLSYMSCLNFVRNACAHNANIVDMRLRTVPIVRDEWKPNLYIYPDRKEYTNRVAIVIMIVKSFISTINPKYLYNNISNSIFKMVNNTDLKAQNLGFLNAAAYKRTLPTKHSHKINKRKK
ncbi:Abi family protein [Enterococcus casseliflavus]|uniref:Abi family protein n=1 Tax=Enterococcus casseliflavus TaxID=37734 RepID=UPI003D0D00F1